MTADIDKAIEVAAPWDLVLTADGEDYPTVRPTVGQVARLQKMSAVNSRDVIDEVKKIFTPEKMPDVEGWTMERTLSAVAHYLAAFSEAAKKNFNPILLVAINAVKEKKKASS